MNLRLIFLIVLLAAFSLSEELYGQSSKRIDPATVATKILEKTITGTVLDENGEPLVGAAVMIDGTHQGVTTNIDGNFSLLCNQKHSNLLITYVGYQPVEMPIDFKTGYVKVVMKPVPNIIDDVIVTGYQSMKRESSTGAYQLISSADLDKRYTGDIMSNIEGKVPGLVKLPEHSNKFGDEQLIIRGMGTFEASTAPLIVVDGLPIEGGMSSVNPYDVENITVLKDAAASSIYGARAANGVIVITTKRANEQKVTIDFNADFTISEKTKYGNLGYATAAELIELEQYNFNSMVAEPGQPNLNQLTNWYNAGHLRDISSVTRLLLQNYLGAISDSDLNSQLNTMSRNNYFQEYQDAYLRQQVSQQYNAAIRVNGSSLKSSIVVNFMRDNAGIQKEYNQSLAFKYAGDLKVANWLNLSFGVNVLNNRSRSHASTVGMSMIDFYPYQSMYNADGSLARMEIGNIGSNFYPGEAAFENAEYGLKDPTFNLIDEMSRNFSNSRYTNVRTYIHALATLMKGWTIEGQFQYEDIYSRTESTFDKDSYHMRQLYNLYTSARTESKTEPVYNDDLYFEDYFAWMDNGMNMDEYDFDGTKWGWRDITTVNHIVNHAVPDGGMYMATTNQGAYYTFRAQTRYTRDFGPHAIDALGGFEYRSTHTWGDSNLLYGYDPQTLTNKNTLVDWDAIIKPGTNVFGSDYQATGAPSSFTTRDVLHRYYSYYFTGNYVYDRRYSLTGSYRVDKTDLFGADPKFRGRPLWSVGGSWNAHNETFLRDSQWLDVLKLRVSYGLAGNIDSSVSSYLTASMGINSYNGNLVGTLLTPPNDQLRWEKTSTWNAGIDFALFNYRLSGSVDWYLKNGSDILTDIDVDPTTGWNTLHLNSGKMRNSGVEIQFNGRIIEANRRNAIGVNAYFNIAFNHNKITGVSHKPSSGSEYLRPGTLHEGYPMNSLFSFNDAGIVEKDGVYYMKWLDKDGDEHITSPSSGDFTIEDAIYCGSTIPKVSGSFTPEITWNGFSLAAMFNFYGGHYMRLGTDDWVSSGSYKGYTVFSSPIRSSALDYWKGESKLPNGYLGKNVDYTIYNNAIYMKSNVQHADYLKLRNIVLSYNFSKGICRKIGLNDLRLRFQFNNVWTWARNNRSIDPESVSLTTGYRYAYAPRSYTMSLFFNL